MRFSDISAGLRLCRLAGWNQVEEDWRCFLELGEDACCVAVNDEQSIVGTVATIRYGSHFSWIGMVLVEPEARGAGVGLGLLRQALRILEREETVKLDATNMGREVYEKLTFADEYHLSRLEARHIPTVKLLDSLISPLHQGDLFELARVDEEVFGANRLPLLIRLFEASPKVAFAIRHRDRISGYCFGRPGHDFMHIGPVVAESWQDATKLVAAALGNCSRTAVIIDAHHHSAEWLKWLASSGFMTQRRFFRMYRGANRYPGQTQKQFAAMGPEFG